MARINPDLLQAIADKLGSTSTRPAYRRVEEVVRDTYLERELAALVVASRLKININKYSTQAQRSLLRGRLAGSASMLESTSGEPISTGAAAPAQRSRQGGGRRARRKDNSVFVISGRDAALTESMFSFLSALGCKPVEFHQAVAKVRGTGNPFIGDVLDRLFEQMQALVVMFSPDDEAKLKDQFLRPNEVQTEGRYRGQARPNVIFEAGMALARHPEKTIMVQVGDIKGFSDIAGRHMVHLDDSYDSRNDFAARLGRLCKVDTSGNRWPKVGKFAPTGAVQLTQTKVTRRKR